MPPDPPASRMPLVIIAYNNPYFVRRFVEQVRRLPNPVIVLDNNSTYAPLLEYYEAARAELGDRLTVHRMPANLGHRVHEHCDFLPRQYLLSDPDLDLHPAMPADVAEQLLRISERHRARKAGLALDISDHQDFIKAGRYGELVFAVESKYYTRRIEDAEYELYEAPVDTTFCLINNDQPPGRHVRVAGDFTARHLPWYEGYLRDNVPADELEAWKADNVSSSILHYVDV